MPEFDLVVRNGTVVSGGGRRAADIGVRDGRIAAIAPRGKLGKTGADELDATGRHVLPGVIDGHVHFREPGLEYKEDWLTGSRAAVMGGVTTVLDMANTVPPTDTVDRARDKLEIAGRSAYCDFGLFGLLGKSHDDVRALAGSGLVIGLKAFLGPTTGGLRAPDDDGLRQALTVTRAAELRVAFHAEDHVVIERAEAAVRAAGRTGALAHLEGRPAEAERAAIERVGGLLVSTRAPGHIVHVSSAAGLAEVERCRARGADLTCEVTPHHVLLDRDAYDTVGGVVRINPPVRGEPDASALFSALADGRVTCIATDHAPHTRAEKTHSDIWQVPSGFAGVETSVRLLLTFGVNTGRLTLEQFVRATSEGPARTWRLWPQKGALVVGSDADLTVVDLEREGVIRADDLHGKHNVNPYDGWRTRGAPVATIVRGRIQMRDGQLTGAPGFGRQVSSGGPSVAQR